jgi:tetrahydromethanopterin S-methyltransferase subunit G
MNNRKETKKEITMDDLARIVQDSFLSVEGRLDNVEEKLEIIKTDTKDIKADLNKKVDRIEHNELEYRVEKLEKKFA